MQITSYNKLPKRILFTLKMLLVGVVALLLSWSLLFFQLKRAFPPEVAKKQLESFITSSDLGITYESIRYTIFEGITIQRLRISSSEDFSLGRILFEAPRVTIPVQIAPIIGSLPRVKIENAEWNLYLENPEEQDLFDKQLEKWSSLATNLKFVLVSNSVLIHLQKANYEKQTIAIRKVSGSFKNMQKGKLEARFAYNSSMLGSGTIQFQQECSGKCSYRQGRLNWEGLRLPLSMLNWWLEDGLEVNGTVSGSVNSQLIPTGNRQQFQAALSLEKLKLYEDEELIIEGFSDHANIFIENTIEKLKVSSTGLWSNHGFQFTYEKRSRAELPNVFKLTLEKPAQQESALQFSQQNYLTGLEHFSLSYLLNDRGIIESSAKLKITAGVLQVSKQEKVQLEDLKLNWEKNFFKLQLFAKRLDSKAEFSLQGPLRLVTRQHIKAAFPLIRGFKRSKREQILTGRGRLDGTLEVEQFDPAQWLGPFKEMQESWHQQILAEEDFRWMPSRVRDRVWFQRFVEGMQYNVRLKFLEIFFSENKFLTIDGFLNVDGFKAVLELEELEKSQRVSIRSLHGGNVPYFTFSFDYLLEGDFPFLNLWHPLPLFASFSSCLGSVRVKTNGELPVHMHYNRQVSEYGNCSEVELERTLQEQGLIPRWDQVRFSSSGRSDSGRLSSIRGIKDKYSFTAGGSYSVLDFNPSYDVKVYAARLP